jgi:hypothetical protein
VTSIHRFSAGTYSGAGRLVIGSAALLTAVIVAGCGGSTVPNSGGLPRPPNSQGQAEPPPPVAQPQTTELTPSAGTELVASVAAKLKANGVACSGFRVTGLDPGAVAQGTCGFPTVIEIAAFPNLDAVSQIFAPFLASDFCGSSLTSLYVDGGMYAVYTVDDTTTQQIAGVLKLSPIKLC